MAKKTKQKQLETNSDTDTVLKYSNIFLIFAVVCFFVIGSVSLTFHYLNYPDAYIDGLYPDDPDQLKVDRLSDEINNYFYLIGVITSIIFVILLLILIIQYYIPISKYMVYFICMLTILGTSIAMLVYVSRLPISLNAISKYDVYFHNWYNKFEIDPLITSYVVVCIILLSMLIVGSIVILTNYIIMPLPDDVKNKIIID